MARRRRGNRDKIEMSHLLNDTDETLTDETVNKPLRFMVLGGDDVLVDKACGTILGERDAFKFGIFETAQVRGQQVSVLKAPSHWLEHLKSYFFLRNGVKSLKNELKYFEMLLFPGPHAFLLVHRDVKNSGREYYLLQALSDVFGEEVLDYCMVIFIDEAMHNNPRKNTCLKMCGGRHHILHNTDESVNKLFKKQEEMTQCKSSNSFKNKWEYFRKAQNYFEAEYKKRENKLMIELAENKQIAENQKKEIDDMKELDAKKDARIKDEQNKLAESKDREKKLQSELDALKSSENQMKEKLKQEVIILEDTEKQLRSELDALKGSENQKEEKLQKLKQELTIYKKKNNKLSSELAALKSSKNQKEEELQKLKQELTVYTQKNNELSSELDALKSSEFQMKDTDESLNKLFKKTMRHNKHLAAENYFEAEYKENYFQRLKEQLISYKDREKQLNNDLKALESSNKQMSEKLSSKEEDLKNCQDREKQLNNKMKALESSNKQMSEKLSSKEEDLKNCQDREKQLNNDLKALESSNKQMSEKLSSKEEDLKNCQDREKQLNNKMKALESSNKQMSEKLSSKEEDLIIWQDRVRQKEKDNKELQEKVDQLKDNVKQLQSNLTAAKITEGFLNSRLQSECDMIQRKEEIQVKEKELHDEERELDRRVVELDKREKNLDEREKQIEIRERELRQADRGSSEHHQTTAVTPSDDCEGELKSREHSQASESHGIHNPLRRNSKELEPPDMSESGPLHNSVNGL